MTEQELDRMERDLWLLLKGTQRDRIQRRQLNKNVKLLLKKQRRNNVLFEERRIQSQIRLTALKNKLRGSEPSVSILLAPHEQSSED